MENKKIKLPFKGKKAILALGSQTKNTVCFAKDSIAYISPAHSDLDNYRDFLNFKKSIQYFLKKRPKIIAYDLHPEYQSTKYAQKLYAIRNTQYAIQHHHAHIASCMVENSLGNRKVIGVAFDGTGIGVNKTLWGAEILVCDYQRFKRKAHLREASLLGGERSILEPWRLAAIWLYSIYKDKFLNLKINFIKKIDKKKWRVLKNMYLVGFNSPLASSMGRLFDAVASLVLEKDKADFEAELAMELEKTAVNYKSEVKSYKFKIIRKKDEYILDPLPMLREIVLDLQRKVSKEKIAYRFHLTIAQMIKKICSVLRKETKISKVVLSGGVFQNRCLLSSSLDLLNKEGFDTFIHKELSCNDSSISLGQMAVANFRS